MPSRARDLLIARATPARPGAAHRSRRVAPAQHLARPCAGPRASRRCRRRCRRCRCAVRRALRPAPHWPGCAARRPAVRARRVEKMMLGERGAVIAAPVRDLVDAGTPADSRNAARGFVSLDQSRLRAEFRRHVATASCAPASAARAIAFAAYSTAWYCPPSMPKRPHRKSIMSLADTPPPSGRSIRCGWCPAHEARSRRSRARRPSRSRRCRTCRRQMHRRSANGCRRRRRTCPGAEMAALRQHDVADALLVVEARDACVGCTSRARIAGYAAALFIVRRHIVVGDEHDLAGSQTSTPSRSSIGSTRRGPPESCIIARSTAQVTISPGDTDARPAARAMIFWASVWWPCCVFRFRDMPV